MVKATNKPADPALKYYFEMLGLPLTASEGEVMAAYAYFQKEQAPGLYVPGSADQKKAEEKQAELKFAFDKLAKWFKENPGSNPAAGDHFRFDGNAEQWQRHQALQWEEQLKEYRSQESAVWTSIQKDRKKARLMGLVKRTRILATIICALSFTGQTWHTDWNKQFRRIQAENLMVLAHGDFMQMKQSPQTIHDNMITKAYSLRQEWSSDDEAAQAAVVWTWILSGLVGIWWLPKEAWDEIKSGYKKATTAKKVA